MRYCLLKKDLSHFTKLDMRNHLCWGKKYHFHSCRNCLFTLSNNQVGCCNQKVQAGKPAWTEQLQPCSRPLAPPACPGPAVEQPARTLDPAKHPSVAPSHGVAPQAGRGSTAQTRLFFLFPLHSSLQEKVRTGRGPFIQQVWGGLFWLCLGSAVTSWKNHFRNNVPTYLCLLHPC